jgi:hypothetical protein
MQTNSETKPTIPRIDVVTLSNMNEEDFSGFGTLTVGSTPVGKGPAVQYVLRAYAVTRTMREEQGN